MTMTMLVAAITGLEFGVAGVVAAPVTVVMDHRGRLGMVGRGAVGFGGGVRHEIKSRRMNTCSSNPCLR